MRFKRFLIPALLLSFLVVSFSFAVPRIQGDESEEKEKEIQELEKKLAEVSGQKQTLAKTVNYLSTRISLTEKQVEQTEAEIAALETEIEVLSGKIDKLNVSLDSLTHILLNRINASYKTSFQDPIYLLLATDGFTNFFRRYKYLKVTQANDREVMFALENARTTFDTQRQVKKDKQDQVLELQSKLEIQQKNLQQQKIEKDHLLSVTKNDEKKFQELLRVAKEEYQAIQAILAGSGTETLVGEINEGDRIASVIQGASCNSNGAHLHFIVKEGNYSVNPFSKLKSDISYENCSGPSPGCNAGDAFNPSGNWNWPISPKIKFSQGYGRTWAVDNTWVGRIYQFHNGLDINGSSSTVTAVKKGKLYRGSYKVGCRLQYVRVDHAEDDFETLYLHVNY